MSKKIKILVSFLTILFCNDLKTADLPAYPSDREIESEARKSLKESTVGTLEMEYTVFETIDSVKLTEKISGTALKNGKKVPQFTQKMLIKSRNDFFFLRFESEAEITYDLMDGVWKANTASAKYSKWDVNTEDDPDFSKAHDFIKKNIDKIVQGKLEKIQKEYDYLTLESGRIKTEEKYSSFVYNTVLRISIENHKYELECPFSLGLKKDGKNWTVKKESFVPLEPFSVCWDADSVTDHTFRRLPKTPLQEKDDFKISSSNMDFLKGKPGKYGLKTENIYSNPVFGGASEALLYIPDSSPVPEKRELIVWLHGVSHSPQGKIERKHFNPPEFLLEIAKKERFTLLSLENTSLELPEFMGSRSLSNYLCSLLSEKGLVDRKMVSILGFSAGGRAGFFTGFNSIDPFTSSTFRKRVSSVQKTFRKIRNLEGEIPDEDFYWNNLDLKEIEFFPYRAVYALKPNFDIKLFRPTAFVHSPISVFSEAHTKNNTGFILEIGGIMEAPDPKGSVIRALSFLKRTVKLKNVQFRQVHSDGHTFGPEDWKFFREHYPAYSGN